MPGHLGDRLGHFNTRDRAGRCARRGVDMEHTHGFTCGRRHPSHGQTHAAQLDEADFIRHG